MRSRGCGEVSTLAERARNRARRKAESYKKLALAEMRRSLLRDPADRRQVGLVLAYNALLALMFTLPAMRTLPCLVAACLLSFINAIVIHNCLHQGIFHSSRLNSAWRMLLSFGALYPASANIASHNLVHHQFDDDGQPDWADSGWVRFKWDLLNILHFPNVAGPNTFEGVSRWAKQVGKDEFRKQYVREQVFAFGLTGVLLALDFWTALFFVVVPQLWGARGILRINIIQHDGCDIESEWNHSRNFVGRFLNWWICNNGYHTIHHNRAAIHWSKLPEWHAKECAPRLHASLAERSMFAYLVRRYLFGFGRHALAGLADAERAAPEVRLAPRAERRAEAETALPA